MEALQQQLFQQRQQVLSLTAQNDSLQSEVESNRSRLQGEAERSAFSQQQLAAEQKLRVQHTEQVWTVSEGIHFCLSSNFVICLRQQHDVHALLV